MVKIKEDLTGWIMKEHGVSNSKLTVIGREEDYVSLQGRSYARWRCLCECGNIIVDTTSNIKSGKRISCGCTRERNKGTRLYNIWSGIKTRCYNPNATHYDKYGGRGITMCNEWKNSFSSFKSWAISNGYQDCLTIDRINTDGNYEPSNCRWVTMKIQSNNRRNNYILEYNGEAHTLSEWSEIINIKVITLWDRLNLLGWSVEQALTTPVKHNNKEVC